VTHKLGSPDITGKANLKERTMHHIHPFVLGLVLVASQAIADESSYLSQGSDPTASPLAAASQAKGMENASPWEGTSLSSAAVQTIGDQDGGASTEQSGSAIAGPYKSDYLDGGYFGGHTD
jgi:hypothetical protein